MGDIADGMINGDFDFYTGEYIGKGGGFPRTHQRKKNHKAGVTKWLLSKGVMDAQEQMTIIREFVPGSTHNDSKSDLCVHISCNWKRFVEWFNKNKSTNQ